ncbi:MAG: DUF4136 domain-containing protein, partial [Bacteroidota bacterium]
MAHSINTTLFILLLIIASCSPKFKVGSDYDPEADFSKYVSFQEDRRRLFKTRSNDVLSSPLTEKRIRNAITRSLQSKGYQMQDSNPDLIFNFQTKSQDRREVRQSNPPAWSYWGRFNYPMVQGQTFVRDYEETTLIVSVLDASTNTLLWQGWVIGEIK